MRPPNFKSEFEDPLPPLEGERVTNSDLDVAVSNVPEHERVELSQQNLLLHAVYDFYFAKHFLRHTQTADYEGDDRLQEGLEYQSWQLMKQAVIGVATTIDITTTKPEPGQTPVGRTASLPHMLDKLRSTLEANAANHADELDLLSTIKANVNPQKNSELEYVQYMRNKWAGHASLDRSFDQWAQAGSLVKIAHVEAALVRVVNAYEDFSDLVRMSAPLDSVVKKPKQAPRIDENGHETWQMTVDWSSIRTFAPSQRHAARQDVDYYFALLASAPSAP